VPTAPDGEQRLIGRHAFGLAADADAIVSASLQLAAMAAFDMEDSTMRNSLVIAGVVFAAGMGSAALAKDVPKGDIDGLVKEGKILSQKQLDDIALKDHPGAKIEDGEIELHKRGYVYEVEVVDAKGDEWDMDIDAKTGKVIRSEKD
jgi:uncharacterized membrane protein YkoI